MTTPRTDAERDRSPLRILRCIRSMSRAYGGPVEGILGFSRVERNYNLRSEIACLDAPDDPKVAADDVTVYCAGPGLSRYGFTLRIIKWLRQNIKNYDIVIIHGVFEFHTIAAGWECVKARMPYVIFTHGMLDPWFERAFPLKHKKKQVYWKIVLGWIFKRSSAVFFTSTQERVLACASFPIGACRSHVVPYGISDPIPSIQHVANKNVPTEPKFILFFGRIDQKKACDLLIQAFKEFCESETLAQNWSLVIAGPSKNQKYLATIKRLASSARIKIEDRLIVGDEKWQMILGCSLFALPSHQENFGIAIAEALACGKPVLVSNKVNIWEDIQQSGAGYVCDDTVESIAVTLKKALTASSQAMVKMGVLARQLFLEKYEVSQSVRSQSAILRKIVDGEEGG